MKVEMPNIKTCIESRRKDGCIVQLDYSQLEIRVLAETSQDPKLIDDLNRGLDLHTVAAAQWKGIPAAAVTAEQRRQAKVMSFALQYGASPKGLAKQLNITVGEARDFIDAYLDRYSKVEEYHQTIIMQAEDNGWMPDDPVLDPVNSIALRETTVGGTAGIDQTSYALRESCPPWAPDRPSFPKTVLKNLEIQGLAADIVHIALGRVHDYLYSNPDVTGHIHMIGTVHDSILLDCAYCALTSVKQIAIIMEETPKYMELFGLRPTSVKFPVDIEIGDTWGSVVPVDRSELETIAEQAMKEYETNDD